MGWFVSSDVSSRKKSRINLKLSVCHLLGPFQYFPIYAHILHSIFPNSHTVLVLMANLNRKLELWSLSHLSAGKQCLSMPKHKLLPTNFLIDCFLLSLHTHSIFIFIYINQSHYTACMLLRYCLACLAYWS